MAIGSDFKNFVFPSQRANGRLGTVFQILYFAVKSRQPFGYNLKILYFAVK